MIFINLQIYLNRFDIFANYIIKRGNDICVYTEISPIDDFQDADVLVDIGADIPDDVFLSSKIISYLPIDRPILALTGANSPARGIMKGCHSIVHCSNQEEDVFQAMQDCIAAIGKGIADRNELLIEFDADTIARKLYDIISDTTH